MRPPPHSVCCRRVSRRRNRSFRHSYRRWRSRSSRPSRRTDNFRIRIPNSLGRERRRRTGSRDHTQPHSPPQRQRPHQPQSRRRPRPYCFSMSEPMSATRLRRSLHRPEPTPASFLRKVSSGVSPLLRTPRCRGIAAPSSPVQRGIAAGVPRQRPMNPPSSKRDESAADPVKQFREISPHAGCSQRGDPALTHSTFGQNFTTTRSLRRTIWGSRLCELAGRSQSAYRPGFNEHRHEIVVRPQPPSFVGD
jgi:hypothetical protein